MLTCWSGDSSDTKDRTVGKILKPNKFEELDLDKPLIVSFISTSFFLFSEWVLREVNTG